jgi:hypothetical protein
MPLIDIPDCAVPCGTDYNEAAQQAQQKDPPPKSIMEERSDDTRIRKSARSLIHQILNIDSKD